MIPHDRGHVDLPQTNNEVVRAAIIQRLGHHLSAFEEACRKDEHAGRKLDFITQEMLREANTIGSKANDASIAKNIVEVKGAIDRLKEQVQNVE